MQWGPALLKPMQVHQILIQIAVLAGFTPTASIVHFQIQIQISTVFNCLSHAIIQEKV